MVLLQGNGPDQPGVLRRAPMADPSRINWDLADWGSGLWRKGWGEGKCGRHGVC